MLSLGKPIEEIEENMREGRKKETRRRIESEILSVLLQSPGLTTREVVGQVHGNGKTVHEVLKEMEASGKFNVVFKDSAKYFSVATIETERKIAA